MVASCRLLTGIEAVAVQRFCRRRRASAARRPGMRSGRLPRQGRVLHPSTCQPRLRSSWSPQPLWPRCSAASSSTALACCSCPRRLQAALLRSWRGQTGGVRLYPAAAAPPRRRCRRLPTAARLCAVRRVCLAATCRTLRVAATGWFRCDVFTFDNRDSDGYFQLNAKIEPASPCVARLCEMHGESLASKQKYAAPALTMSALSCSASGPAFERLSARQLAPGQKLCCGRCTHRGAAPAAVGAITRRMGPLPIAGRAGRAEPPHQALGCQRRH